MKRTTAGSAETTEANYAPAEAAEALVTKKGFCSSTAWTAAATSESSSAARAVTAASARAVEEGVGKRAIAIEHHCTLASHEGCEFLHIVPIRALWVTQAREREALVARLGSQGRDTAVKSRLSCTALPAAGAAHCSPYI